MWTFAPSLFSNSTAPCGNILYMRKDLFHLNLSLLLNKCSLELNWSTNNQPQILTFQLFGRNTSLSSLCRWLTFHRTWGETHQDNSTQLFFVLPLHSNPSLIFLSPKSCCALTRAVSDKPSHIQGFMEKYLWESCMQFNRPNEHHQSSLTDPLY